LSISPDQIESAATRLRHPLPATLLHQVMSSSSATARAKTGPASRWCDQFTHISALGGFAAGCSPTATRRQRGNRWSGVWRCRPRARPDGGQRVSSPITTATGVWVCKVSGDFSDTTRAGVVGRANAGQPQRGPRPGRRNLHGENDASAGGYNGFLGRWNGASIPSRDVQPRRQRGCERLEGSPKGVFLGQQEHGSKDSTLSEATVGGAVNGRASWTSTPRAQAGPATTLDAHQFCSTKRRESGIQFNSTNCGRDLRAIAVEEHGSTALSQLQHAPPRHRRGPVRKFSPPRCLRKMPGDVDSSRRASEGIPRAEL